MPSMDKTNYPHSEEIRLERSAESSGEETARVEKRAAIDTGSDYPGFEGGKRRFVLFLVFKFL